MKDLYLKIGNKKSSSLRDDDFKFFESLLKEDQRIISFKRIENKNKYLIESNLQDFKDYEIRTSRKEMSVGAICQILYETIEERRQRISEERRQRIIEENRRQNEEILYLENHKEKLKKFVEIAKKYKLDLYDICKHHNLVFSGRPMPQKLYKVFDMIAEFNEFESGVKQDGCNYLFFRSYVKDLNKIFNETS